jgi:hypothetical protein
MRQGRKAMISKRVSAAILFAAALISGCATPVFMLKNEKTGQIVRCGGGVTGSMAGGLIGYNMQKKTDKACVKDFENRGFTPIRN